LLCHRNGLELLPGDSDGWWPFTPGAVRSANKLRCVFLDSDVRDPNCRGLLGAELTDASASRPQLSGEGKGPGRQVQSLPSAQHRAAGRRLRDWLVLFQWREVAVSCCRYHRCRGEASSAGLTGVVAHQIIGCIDDARAKSLSQSAKVKVFYFKTKAGILKQIAGYFVFAGANASSAIAFTYTATGRATPIIPFSIYVHVSHIQ
ncbi:unnamed protein product, partial [Ectocarpus sp. 12 AP-2014]